MEVLDKHPSNGIPPRFVSIHEGVSGWNSSLWSWSPCATMAAGGFYEPEQTGFTNTSLGTRLREDAIAEARHWAECEELPLYIPTADKEPPEDNLLQAVTTNHAALSPFDSQRTYATPGDVVAYCRQYPDPQGCFMATVAANLAMDEVGFAKEILDYWQDL